MLRDKKIFSYSLRFLGLALPVALFFICFRNVDWKTLSHALMSIPLSAVLVILLLVFLIPVLKCGQWKLFLGSYGRIPFHALYQTVAVWMMAFNVFPLWAGEGLAIFLMSKKDRVPKSVALSVITLDQICEGISLAVIFSVLAWAAAIPDWMRLGMKLALGFILTAFAVLLYLSMRFRGLPSQPESSPGFWGKFRFHAAKWAHHLEPLRKPKKLIFALSFTLAVRAIEIGVLAFLEREMGLGLPFYSPFLVIAALHLAMIIPFSPGNLGVFEATVFFVYRFLGVDPAPALGIALLFHAFTALPIIVQGYAIYLRLGVNGKRLMAPSHSLMQQI